MKIELGGGRRAKPGWLCADVNPAYADIVCDVRGPIPLGDCVVDELRAVDVLEHISYRHTAGALAEWARLCAPGAAVYVQVPDAAEIMRWFVEAPHLLAHTVEGGCSAMKGAEWRLLGGHADGVYVDVGGDWRWNAHYSLWDRESLVDAMFDAGFDVLRCETNAHPNLLYRGVRQ